MECFGEKKKSNQSERRRVRGLTEKLRHLQEEMKAIMNEREKESRGFERDMMVFAFKEAEWKQEKKRLKEEVKRLRKVVEEKEDKIRGTMEGHSHNNNNGELVVVGEKSEEDCWEVLVSGRDWEEEEERVFRDEAVDKWKKLYLAIKTELDNLIQRTRQEGLYWRAEEEDMIEELKMEVKAKEETIKDLKSKLALVELEGYKREREVDILRQSLRIMSSWKGASVVGFSHRTYTKGQLGLISAVRSQPC